MTLQPVDLRCEHLVDPLGVEHPNPRLAWALRGARRGMRQSAWQVRVASSAAQLALGDADLWDSGQVSGPERGTAQLIAYAGATLGPRAQAYWQVRAWDERGAAGQWSAAACWQMGLLAPGDWRARWIGRTLDAAPMPAPMLRRAFALRAAARRATLHACGLGYGELHLNGRVIGDRLLDPGYTRYDRRALYASHDVTALVRPGANAVGAILGTGWYNVHTAAVWGFHKAPWRGSPRLLLQLHIAYEDGGEEVIVSDERWRTAEGPIRYDSIYGGESYDARHELAGWDEPGFDDAAWAPALGVPGPGGVLSAQMSPPIRARRQLEPRAITQPKPGIFVVDFGQAFAGHARIALSAPAGTEITLRYGERLGDDGMLDTAAIAEHMTRADPAFRFQTDTYLCAGRGRERWEARFTYHGFRWVEISGWPVAPGFGDIVGVEHHTDLEPAGAFSCAQPLLERIALATDWAYLSNFQSIPTDCPQREKNGWTGDAHLACEQGMFTYRAVAAYEKWLDDLADEQRPSGELPGIVPSCGWGYEWGNGPAWDSAYHLIAWTLYEHTGDLRPLERHYDRLKRYVDYLGTRAEQGIVAIGLGDWCPANAETPAEVTSTACYFADAQIVARAAALLGKPDDARAYAALADSIRRAFVARFRGERGSWANGSQTALACALHFGLADEADRVATVQALVEAVERADWHLDCGILGTSWLLRVLHQHGRDDVALRIATQETFPSWGAWLTQGATTLWENWNGAASRNHIMFGDVVAWMYRALGGIAPDAGRPGFAGVVIEPPLLEALPYASVRHHSIRGPIVVAWRREGGAMAIDLSLPPNTEALLRAPTADPALVRESDGPAATSAGVSLLGVRSGRAEFSVGSGDYRFVVG